MKRRDAVAWGFVGCMVARLVGGVVRHVYVTERDRRTAAAMFAGWSAEFDRHRERLDTLG